ncbi:MAG TPA: primase-helicase family protein [Steroidobacteraceae bacterium]|nr:primase-helicase family protein [Steroidobacteraceae bacterium]
MAQITPAHTGIGIGVMSTPAKIAPHVARTSMQKRVIEGEYLGAQGRIFGTVSGGAHDLRDFYAFLPSHQYIYLPTGRLWPAASVNSSVPPVIGADGVPLKASEWLDHHRHVEQMTWCPGYPQIIQGRLMARGGWIDCPTASTYNLYVPPAALAGVADYATPWIDHARHVFPEDADHIFLWLAHRVQRPSEKVNHALVLGGSQGVGKDTLLEPIKRAIGPWNCSEVSPAQLIGRFNSFAKSVILRISEARDLGEVDRYGFYEHLKLYTAAPPDVLMCDEKNVKEHHVLNACGVIITTNHKGDGIYLPPDDRRHYVAWSALTKEDFKPSYWNELWQWYDTGGIGHVAAYLRELDLSGFDSKAPPRKTQAFHDIVDANRAPEDSELADVIDALGNPTAVTLTILANHADPEFSRWLLSRRNSRLIPRRLEAVGYVGVRNGGAGDGLWRLNKRRQMIYARRELCVRDRLAAVTALVGR